MSHETVSDPISTERLPFLLKAGKLLPQLIPRFLKDLIRFNAIDAEERLNKELIQLLSGVKVVFIDAHGLLVELPNNLDSWAHWNKRLCEALNEAGITVDVDAMLTKQNSIYEEMVAVEESDLTKADKEKEIKKLVNKMVRHWTRNKKFKISQALADKIAADYTVKPAAKEVIELFQQLGIDVVIITASYDLSAKKLHEEFGVPVLSNSRLVFKPDEEIADPEAVDLEAYLATMEMVIAYKVHKATQVVIHMENNDLDGDAVALIGHGDGEVPLFRILKKRGICVDPGNSKLSALALATIDGLKPLEKVLKMMLARRARKRQIH